MKNVRQIIKNTTTMSAGKSQSWYHYATSERKMAAQ